MYDVPCLSMSLSPNALFFLFGKIDKSQQGETSKQTMSKWQMALSRGGIRRLLPDVCDDQQLLAQMSEMWGAYVGEVVRRQSLRFAWMEERCGGGEFLPVLSTYSFHQLTV